jgi:hypothetical protein
VEHQLLPAGQSIFKTRLEKQGGLLGFSFAEQNGELKMV